MKNIMINEESPLEYRVLANTNFKTFDLGYKTDVCFFNADMSCQVVKKRYGYLVMNLLTGNRTLRKSFDYETFKEVVNSLGIKNDL